ncbi:hypothetical protein [Sphingobium sp. Z007]|uniref:hypothetical protein n=1 Tax=Sphingobium sp. Z007 TaxID=627495 RepID=UPI000B49F35F|nr:hypothetical protein [Sphingobium sp. Z007]
MTPFERAQAAAWNELSRQGVQTPVDPESINGALDMRAIVHAILTAIHEPSQEMAEAGAEVIRAVSADEIADAYQSDAANTWRLMVDILLERG